jgi:hypothetical protein
VTFYAETDGDLVGTMSLCLDLHGRLPADENFADRLAPLRRAGRRLCEPSRLAIDRGMSKRVFAALIHISYLYAHKLHGFSDYVIEVNPRHVAFYQRMLGFADFGGERPCSRVGAPAVLLRLPLSHMGAQIREWGGRFDEPGAERRARVRVVAHVLHADADVEAELGGEEHHREDHGARGRHRDDPPVRARERVAVEEGDGVLDDVGDCVAVMVPDGLAPGESVDVGDAKLAHESATLPSPPLTRAAPALVAFLYESASAPPKAHDEPPPPGPLT